MSIYYDLYETPVREGEERRPLHARVCSKGTISGETFLEQVAQDHHIPLSSIQAAVQAIGDSLVRSLADGYSVELGRLGYFSTTLTCKRPALTKKDIRAESVGLGTIRFRPAKEFRLNVARKMEVKRSLTQHPAAASDAQSVEERMRQMLAFLKTNVCINRTEYVCLTGVSNRRASDELQKFCASGIIRKRGGGRAVVYIKA